MVSTKSMLIQLDTDNALPFANRGRVVASCWPRGVVGGYVGANEHKTGVKWPGKGCNLSPDKQCGQNICLTYADGCAAKIAGLTAIGRFRLPISGVDMVLGRD